MAEVEPKKLNKGLKVEELWICVPKKCRLHYETPPVDDLDGAWATYLGELGFTEKDSEDKGDCWRLKGRAAIKHSCRVHERIQRQLLRFPGVSATDVGFVVREGFKEFLNVLAIRIHVTKKLTWYQLWEAGLPDLTWLCYAIPALQKAGGSKATQAAEIDKRCQALSPWRESGGSLPQGAYNRYPVAGVIADDLSLRVPDATEPEPKCDRLCICGVPLDIIHAKYFPSALGSGEDRTDGVFVDPPKTSNELSNEEMVLTGRGRVNPLVGGVSVGGVSGQAGTLGTVVWDRTDGTPCILSNWHVLAGSASAMVGQPCYQPALFDGGTHADTVAHLKRWHLGEHGDAAIAELSGSRSFASSEVLGLWSALSDYKEPELNLPVRKWGRTTGFTEGFIDGIHLATNIDYGNGLVRHFKHQFHIAPLYSGFDVSQVGDSGSLVVTCYKPGKLIEDLETSLRAMEDCCTDGKYLAKLKKALKEKQEADGMLVADRIARSELIKIAAKNAANPTPDEEERQRFLKLLQELLPDQLRARAIDFESELEAQEDKCNRRKLRVYFAVGMIFAGDTPGSPFGEFALASPLGLLADELKFSLRPVFEPRSSFRKLRSEPAGSGRDRETDSGGGRAPGAQGADPRGQGPQPDGASTVTGPGSKP